MRNRYCGYISNCIEQKYYSIFGPLQFISCISKFENKLKYNYANVVIVRELKLMFCNI